MKLSIGLLLVTSLALAGCASNNQKIDITTTPVKVPHIYLPTPDEFVADPIKWYVISKKIPPGMYGSIDHFWKTVEADGVSAGVIITPGDYKNLTRNQAKLRTYILQQKAVIAAYRRFYEANK